MIRKTERIPEISPIEEDFGRMMRFRPCEQLNIRKIPRLFPQVYASRKDLSIISDLQPGRHLGQEKRHNDGHGQENEPNPVFISWHTRNQCVSSPENEIGRDKKAKEVSHISDTRLYNQRISQHE